MMGRNICQALAINAGLKENPIIAKEEILKELAENPELLIENDEDGSSGSDSDPSEDNFDLEEL